MSGVRQASLKIDEAPPVWCSDRCSDNHHSTPMERSRFKKSVVRIERQGKRSDGRASTPEEIDSTVALMMHAKRYNYLR